MKRSASRGRLRHLEDLFRAGTVGDLSDGELLDRFVRCRDDAGESAFAALVERHGPMVFRVCRQALHDPHAAEDAAQVTFLVLARQAGTIRKRPSVSSWLFGVARRASARINMQETRRRRYESRSAERAIAVGSTSTPPADLDTTLELHAKVDRLPEKYRLPIVLCYFEGLTHEQAASRLQWPVGTVKTRLSRARSRLRSRLEPHGQPSALPVPIPAEFPGRLLDTITRMGCRAAAGGMPVGPAPSHVIAITREVMRSMLIHKLKSTAVMTCGLFLLGLGVLVAAQQATGKGRAIPPEAAIAEAKGATSTLHLIGTTEHDPATETTAHLPLQGRVDKILVALGSVIKPGDPLLEFLSTDLAAAKSDYELAVSQWVHDKKVYDYKKPLADTDTLSRKEAIDVENDEQQSRLKMKLAKDKLLVYGLTEQEIENIKNEDGQAKARMILRARANGVLVRRNAVPGNYYDSKDALLTIVQLDHLRVTARIGEADIDQVKTGQDLTVIFPSFSDRRVKAKLDDINPRTIDLRTHTVELRATVPNPDRRLKPGLFARLELETQGRPDQIEVPPGLGKPAPVATTIGRLETLERKLDQLLGEEEERSLDAKILERLDALERKLDQLLDKRRQKSP